MGIELVALEGLGEGERGARPDPVCERRDVAVAFQLWGKYPLSSV